LREHRRSSGSIPSSVPRAGGQPGYPTPPFSASCETALCYDAAWSPGGPSCCSCSSACGTLQKWLTRNPWTIHMPRQNSLVVLAWRREKLRRVVTSLSPQAASWLMSLEPTSPGRRSLRVEIHSADSTRRPQTGKPRSPALVPTVNPTIARSSLASALTVPSNRTNRMLKKPASFVLVSSKSSTYPRGYASGFDSPAALLNGLFQHPGPYSSTIPGVTTTDTAACPPSVLPTASHHVLS
jgi:hypothetical protein